MPKQCPERDVAKSAGLTRYFTGKPCPRGHVAERSVSSYGCLECQREKAATEKGKERSRKSAQRLRDRLGKDEVNRQQREWRQAHKEHVSERHLRWRQANPESVKRTQIKVYQEHRSKKLTYSRQWHQENREQALSRMRENYRADPERHKARSRRWAKANPDAVRERVQLRAHKQRAAEGEFTRDDIRRILSAQRGRCAYCRCDIRKRFSIDHIHPISKGGTNWPRNLQLTCKSCNSRKRDKLPEDFAQELGLLL